MNHSPNDIDHLFRGRLYDAEVPPPAFVWPGVERALRRRRRRWLFVWCFVGALGLGLATWSVWPTGSNPGLAAGIPSAQGSTQNTTTTQAAISLPAATATGTAVGTPQSDPTTALARQAGQTPDDHPAAERPVSLRAPRSVGRSDAPVIGPIDGASPDIEVAPVSGGHATAPVSLLPARQAGLLLRAGPPPSALALSKPVSGLSPSTVAAAPPPAVPAEKKMPPGKNRSRHCYDFSRHPSATLVEVYAGPSFERKSLRTLVDTQSVYRESRLASERADWAFNGGLRLAHIFGRNFVLRTGLHYEQVVEVFEHLQERVRITEEHIDPVTGEMTTYVNSYDVYYKYFNRLGWLDVPVQLGMELRAGRVGVSLHTGATVNLLFWKQGRILSPVDGRPVDLNSRQPGDQVFRRHTGVSMMSNVQCFYYLSPHTRVFVEPYYRQILRPINVPDFPLTQRYSFWGLQVGMSHILN